MKRLGGIVSSTAQPHDIIFLTGEMGTGKSRFAQGFVQSLCRDDTMAVPSPTFFLDNTYPIKFQFPKMQTFVPHVTGGVAGKDVTSTVAVGDGDGGGEGEDVVIHHMDLYRLGQDLSSQQLSRIHIPQVFDQRTISLIEWADYLIRYNEQSGDVLGLSHRNILRVMLEYSNSNTNSSSNSSLPFSLPLSTTDDTNNNEEYDDYGEEEDRIVTLSTNSEAWKARIQHVLDQMTVMEQHDGNDRSCPE